MSLPLKEELHDVESFFDVLWDDMIDGWFTSSSGNNFVAADAVQIFKREMGTIVNMVPYRESLNLSNDVKDQAKSIEMRNKGNETFHPGAKRYAESIKCYNESIAYSKPGSEERALAYANRSIVCLEMRRYEECLANIRLARESNYPERLAAKLAKREMVAKKALEATAASSKESKNGAQQERKQLTLSHPAHENAPQVSNCLELKRNDKYGRHVVTNRPLKVGDVVMIEKPVVTLLEDKLRYLQCAYCFSETPFTLIPCEGCTLAMYCSEECLSKAQRQYHRYECGIIRDLWKISEMHAVLALRAVAAAVAAFDHDLLAIEKHLAALDESSVNLFAMDWKSATPKDIFNAVYVQSTNEQHRQRKDLAYHVFFAALLHKMVLERTELGSLCGTNPTKKRLLFDLFVRYLQIMQCNYHWLTFMERHLELNMRDIEGYAAGCFPLLNMLNHSCASNVKRIHLSGDRCGVIVSRPIAAGGQLFDNYDLHHLFHDRDERQDALQSMYHFRCDCEACLHDYPDLELLPQGDGSTFDILRFYYIRAKELDPHDPRKTEQLMSMLQVLLTENADRYPSMDVCTIQIEFERCFQILYSYKSYEIALESV